MQKITQLLACVIGVAGLTACGMTVKEKHYLVAYDEREGTITDYYRVNVRASARLSNAHYTAGIYDERALDLMFNEIRSAGDDSRPDRSLRSISQATGNCNQTDNTPETSDDANNNKYEEVEGICVENGEFAFILSTDAAAIANTISSFAQSEALATSIYRLANKDLLREAESVEATTAVHQAIGKAFTRRLESYLQQAASLASRLSEPGSEETPEDVQKVLLAMLSSIARELGKPGSFDTIAQAETFFSQRINNGARR